MLDAQGVPSLAEPGISPDGSEIAFTSGGDIWTVPAQGGVARILVAHEAHESRPMYSPDGRWLAFNSNREGSTDIHLLELETGAIQRLTHNSGSEQLTGWSRDSEWVYFNSTSSDIGSMSDVLRVRVTGGTPMPIIADRYEGEFFASEGPDGRIAISTRGNMARGQWWRNGHSHIDEAEIWLVEMGDEPQYSALSAGGKNLWPMWTSTGDAVVFMSDRNGTENLWSAPADGGAAQRITDFNDGRLLWPSMAADAPIVAFEREFGIWTHDLADGSTAPVSIELRGAVQSPRPEVQSVSTGLGFLRLSPDGKKIAFTARGEIFAASAEDGGDAFRVTNTRAAETGPVWSSDSNQLVYLSWRSGVPQLHHYDFLTGEERSLTDSGVREFAPLFSPEGNEVAFVRGWSELRVLDLDTGSERLLATGTIARGPFLGNTSLSWSPDGEWIAYMGQQTGDFTNVHVVPAAGGESRPVSFLANAFSGSLVWAPDGSAIYYQSRQRTESGSLVRIDLVPTPPEFEEEEFEELFERPEEPSGEEGEAEAEGADPDPIRIEFEGIGRRASLINVGVDVGSLTLSPDGEQVVVAASAEGRQNLYVYPVGPSASGPRIARQLTSTGGGKGSIQFAPNGNEVYFLSGGRVQVVNVSSGNIRTVGVTAEFDADFHADKVAAFEQAWTELRDGFYDEDLHGVDWSAARARFAPHIEGARTSTEFNRLMNLMIGELNGSHLGHSGGTGGPGPAVQTGRLGLAFDPVAYEDDGLFRITEVLSLGPAGISGEVSVGDLLLAVNGTTLDGTSDLDLLLAGTTGDRVRIDVGQGDGAGESRTIEVQPISTGAERNLRYRAWVDGRRAYVEEQSGGRLGYVHLPDMGAGTLAQLYLDLDQDNHDKDGIVIDVRNNNGGFVNVYAIDVFARRNYFSMRPRGGQESPSRLQLGQRAILAPSVLVTNQHTLSDGEDFTEGFRALELGSVIGEPTAGWIIYTSSVGLVNGTQIRMPYIEVRGMDGEVMELNPRPVDVDVERPAGESYGANDSQLDAAIATLLGQIGGG